MRLKETALLLSALSLSSVLAVQADEAQVREAEKSLQSYLKRQGANSDGYSGRLYYLATVYQENGLREKAQQMYEKAIGYEKKRGLSFAIDTMESWAVTLMTPRRVYSFPNNTSDAEKNKYFAADKLAHQKDIARAYKILYEAKELSKTLPAGDRSKFTAQMSLLRRQKPVEARREETQLVSEVRADFKAAKSEAEICNLAMVMQELADYYRSGDKRSIPQAVKYKLEYLAMMDKLPKTNQKRIRAHRTAVAWYGSVGESSLAKQETKQLALLLGTEDKDKLFPPRRPCPACGRG